MIRRTVALAVVMAHLGTVAWAGGYTARTHFYEVEYLKPVAGMGTLSTLNVTFNRTLDAKEAERALHDELQRVVSLFPPKGDVMAWAWTEPGPAVESQEMIPLTDGSQYLIYSLATKQIQTAKQYEKAKKSAARSK